MTDNIIHIRGRAEYRSHPEPTLAPGDTVLINLAGSDLHRCIMEGRSDNLREPRIDPYEMLRKSGYRPSLAERLGDVFGSEFGAGFYLGVWAGALFTVVAAFFVAGLA